MEAYARPALLECDGAYCFNREKGMRILRTCVIEVFDCQIDYFKTLSFYDPRWGEVIVKSTIDSALGLMSSTFFDYTSARKELSDTLSAHISQRGDVGTQPQVSNAASASDSPLMVMAKTAARRAQQQVFAPVPPAPKLNTKDQRREVVDSILTEKGWSILDWANEAEVAHATAMDYLQGKTRPYRSTLLKLAKALGIPVAKLPR
jgi:lambda repressor-like predicted transcriptional regulator